MSRFSPTFLLALSAVLCVSCVGTRVRPLDADQRQAILIADAFIARHGYTTAGHPIDRPVENVELFDGFDNPERVVERRRDTLESHAYAIAFTERGNYLVLFHRTHGTPGFRAVWVKNRKAVEVVHATPILDRMLVVSVPSNFRWSGP